MPYHHKAAQHEWARAGRIVRERRGAGASGSAEGERGAARHCWLLCSPPRDGRGAATRTRASSHLPSPRPANNPYSHLATTYLDVINTIIVRHQLVR